MTKKKKTTIIIVALIIIVIIYFTLIKKGSGSISGSILGGNDKYEGKYIYTDYDGTGNNSPTYHTWLIKDGKPVRWDSTGISGDRNVAGSVYDVRTKVTKEELLKYF